MRRTLSLVYGILAYLLFLVVFAYSIGFVGDFLVPRTIDTGPSAALGVALAIDLGLLALFAVQHSGMARQGFKERWTRIVPRHVERSTYVLAATVTLAVVMWLWRPIPATIWSIEHPVAVAVLEGLFWAGWGIVLLSTFLIDHFDLFGLKQVWAHFRGEEPSAPEFQTPGLYRYVRHPLYLGFLMAFWATPHMTAGHLLFAGGVTGYILLAIQFEEKDLVRFHGAAYREYRRRVPMLFPTGKTAGAPEGVDATEGIEETRGR